MKFGALLRKARLNAGLSQEELAPLILLPRSTVSKMENDRMEPKGSDLIRWCQATQVPELAAALLCGVDVATLTQFISSVTTFIGGIALWI